ncbi:MAG: cation transporter [Alkaliphilus sp.]|nr:cation transporter [Alkaliphilus sp.]
MKKKISIEGMSCGHCSARVEKILKEQEAVGADPCVCPLMTHN